MNLREYKKQFKKEQVIKDSFINYNVLWQCRELTPEKRIVGKDENGNEIFFEETPTSLQHRHYGKSDKATSFNLVYNDKSEIKLVTMEYLANTNILFNDDYDFNILINFLSKNNHRFNALSKEKRKRYCFYLTENEIDIVKDFIEKMREYRGKNDNR